jgi:hypothetical protein
MVVTTIAGTIFALLCWYFQNHQINMISKAALVFLSGFIFQSTLTFAQGQAAIKSPLVQEVSTKLKLANNENAKLKPSRSKAIATFDISTETTGQIRILKEGIDEYQILLASEDGLGVLCGYDLPHSAEVHLVPFYKLSKGKYEIILRHRNGSEERLPIEITEQILE